MKRGNLIRQSAVLAALFVAACEGGSEGDAPEQPAQARQVSVAQVERRPLVGGITASGVLVPREEAAVGTEIGGYRIQQVLAEEGDRVRAGQPLVRMDPALLRSQVTQAEANLAQQRAQAAQAEREAARVAGLDDQGVVATETIEQRRTAAAGARAAARAAEAQLAELQTRLDRLTVRAPVAGRILERNVRPGEIAAAGGAPMFRIARDGLVELEASVPEAELGSIQRGQPVQVRLPTGETVQGSVRMVSARVADSRLGNVRVALPQRDDLRPGGFGQATFGAAATEVAAVPENALRFDAEGVSVITLTQDDRARRVPVRTGRRANGWVELVSGPEPGTRVLLGGGAFVLEGDRVRPVLVRPGADGRAQGRASASPPRDEAPAAADAEQGGGTP